MAYIDKSALAAELERLKSIQFSIFSKGESIGRCYDSLTCISVYNEILSFLNTFEVKEVNEQCVQYDSIKAGIQAYAETYSFNIESLLFNQLTKEQQVLWRKEIEQACISGGEVGVELAKDIRYKENVEVKEVGLEKHLKEDIEDVFFDLDGVAVKGATHYLTVEDVKDIAKHFFELGMAVSNKARKGEEV